MTRQRQGVKEDSTTAVVMSYDSSTHKGAYTPNASNYYLLATTKFTWVKFEVDTATKKISRYVVWHRGTVAVYTTEEANNFINLEWQDYPDGNKSPYTTTPNYDYVNDFVVVDGFSFRALEANKSETTYDYYKKKYYE